VTQVDVVVVQLETQKKMEIKKKESCVSEKNAATEQRQRRITDKSKLDNTLATLTADIKSATESIAAIAKQIEELQTAMAESKKARQEENEEFKKSVQEQVDQQKLLYEAVAALKKFYGQTKLLQTQGKTLPTKMLSAKVFSSAPFYHVKLATKHELETVAKSPQNPKAYASRELSAIQQDPGIEQQSIEEKKLDEGVANNMDAKWQSVKDVKAKRTEAPKSFEKPLKEHGGTKGIIGILEIIIEESEHFIKQNVVDEQKSLQLHLASIEATNEVIVGKEKESVMLEQVRSENELKKTQTESELKAVETEIVEIDEFLVMVDKQCQSFLSNFQANQEARAQEISDTKRAKELLLGMAEE
jgi:hypothetical protein